MERALPEVTRFAAIDALRYPQFAAKAAADLGIRLAPDWEKQATSGQIGCCVSHVSVWKEAAGSARPWTVVLEDDAVINETLFSSTVDGMLAELEDSGRDFDILYLYLHPEQRPASLRLASLPLEPPLTQEGFHSWCLLAYVLSRKGASRLLGHVNNCDEEIYCPIDNWVSDLRKRGKLDVMCPTVHGFVTNGGQIDLREQGEDGGQAYLKSNLWGSPLWMEMNKT